MPICTCGCNQELSRQSIKKHQRGQAVPCLVSAAISAFHAHGLTVSPPWLNPAKKLRTSHRYFPSLLDPSVGPSAGDNCAPMDSIEGEHESMGVSTSVDPEDDSCTEEVMDHMQHGVWSGQDHAGSLSLTCWCTSSHPKLHLCVALWWRAWPILFKNLTGTTCDSSLALSKLVATIWSLSLPCWYISYLSESHLRTTPWRPPPLMQAVKCRVKHAENFDLKHSENWRVNLLGQL
jgi:hypothetical protein